MRSAIIACAVGLAALPVRASYIEVTPAATIDFGDVAVGELSLKTFTVRNVKSTVQDRAFAISSVSVAGAGFAQGPNACPATLALGASCDIGVSFKPTSAGSKTGTFTVVTSGGTFGRSLVGNGQVAVAVAPTHLDFGPVRIGERTSATVLITNVSKQDYFTITPSGGSVVEVSYVDAVLRPQGEMTLTVTFAPADVREYSDVITLAWASTTGSGVSGGISITITGSGYASSDGADGGSLGLPGCFIATAAYGSPLEPEVQALRAFRDDYLVTGRVPFGPRFVTWYYRSSPPVAELIARHEPLRAVTRVALTPVVLAVAHPGAALVVLGASVTAGAWVWRRRRGRVGSPPSSASACPRLKTLP